jgi:hypothetical protein
MQANMWSGILNGLMGAGMMAATGGMSGLFGGGGAGGILSAVGGNPMDAGLPGISPGLGGTPDPLFGGSNWLPFP